MNKLFTAFCALLCFTSAYAGTQMSSKDKEMTAAVPVPECNWTGFYIGGNAGFNGNYYDFSSSDVTVDQTNMVTGPVKFQLNDAQGRDELEFLGGGQAGYLWQFHRWVVGLEFDGQKMGDADRKTHISRFATETTFFSESDTVARFDRSVKTEWMASGRLRIGYTFNCIMIYATGGGAMAGQTADFVGRATTTSFFTGGEALGPVGGIIQNTTVSNRVSSSDDNTLVGWTVGGGIDWQACRWARLGVEYRHTEFGSESYKFAGGTGISSSSTDVGLVNDQVTLRVNIPFAAFFGGR